MKERTLLERIFVAYRPAKLFRNDTGQGWVGGRMTRINGGILLRGAQRIAYGLLKGSGDLIGWTPVVITEDMVGQTIAQFTSIEAKTENDKLRPEQENWFRQVRAAGGRALIVWEHMGQLTEFEP